MTINYYDKTVEGKIGSIIERKIIYVSLLLEIANRNKLETSPRTRYKRLVVNSMLR